MAKIREDLTGAVHVGGVVLFAGDDVPAGVKVGQWLIGDSSAAGVDSSTAHVSTVEADAGAEDGEFEPSEHSGPEVIAYLTTADPDEFDRVTFAETEGKNRKTVLDAAAKQMAGEADAGT